MRTPMKKQEKYIGIPMKKQRKEKKSRVLIWLIAFFIMMVIAVFVFPQTEDGEMNVPDWYITLSAILPVLIAVFWRRTFLKNAIEKISCPIFQKTIDTEKGEFKVPKSVKGQEGLAGKLLESAKAYADLANTSDDIGMFILWYDDAISDLEKISLLEKSSIRDQAQRNLYRLKSETQWHLCDALNRQKERVLSDIKGKYKNSREFQEKQYELFKDDIDEIKPRFSDKTASFAQECLVEIEKYLGINQEEKRVIPPITYGGLSGIDFMEGHQFEHWCANLLRKIGFINVEVTQGSGDQGVDILAEKDGIKYAIQCKCYSSDLGNKPIQEVNTGKAIYHCQIGAVMTNRYFTSGGIEAAEATGVLRWDRGWIQERLAEIG